jgi:hypothetical protein
VADVKVLVCGSRDWTDRALIESVIHGLAFRFGPDVPDAEVIHGACRGADQIAGAYAASLGLRVTEFPADWAGKGKRAGILRNLAMLDEKPDAVIAFQRNGSRGTQHTIDEARKRGIPVEVVSA